MIGLVRAAVLCATLALGLVTAQAADKAFKRDDLADSAIKLEAQIRSEAGPVAKSGATLRSDADAAFKRNDFRAGLQILGQIAATAPEDSSNWLRLARTIFQIRPSNSSEQTFFLERASTAAYLAYQRAANAGDEADALAVLGRALSERKLWRPALDALRMSLDMREVADVRGQYEKLRDEYGFRLMDYTVDSDSASPRACFQFSEELAKRIDFAPYLALAGTDKPALTSEGKQLCVDGLKHGERYNINLRAGLPSTVREGLPKSAEFNIYVRDRKPLVRFTGRAYVLPRTGQRGITAFSGNDGIHVFVNSLASTDAVARAEVRLIARNNEILAARKTDDSGHVLLEAGLARGEGGLSPAMLTVTGEKTDYAFLSLKSSAFDLSDRGVKGREVPVGADAFVYAERGVYRSNETVYLTALLRDGQGNAVTGGPLTLVIERPDGVEFRRAVLADQGAGGRSLAVPLNSAVPTGTWRVRAFTDPKGSSVGDTTFMVEDYVPERIEFDLTSRDKLIKAEAPVELKVDGHFLYGAPASGLQLEGDVLVAPAAERPGFAGYQFGVADEETSSNERTPIENLPEADANGFATFPVSLAKPPSSTRPQEAQIFVRMAEAGGRAVERKLVLPVAPATAMIGVKPLFGGKSVPEGDKAVFDVIFASPDGKTVARDGLRYELLKLESRYQWYRQNSYWEYEPVKSTTRVADGDLAIAADQPSRITLSPQPGRYRLDVKSSEVDGPLTSVQFDVGWYSDGSADTPDLLETSIDKPEYQSGDTMVVSVNARTAGKLSVNVLGDRLLTTQTTDVKEGTAQVKIPVGKDWGTGAYVVATLRRPLDAAALRMPGRAIGLEWFGIDKKTRTLEVKLSPQALVRPNSSLKIPVKLGGLNPGEDAKVVVAAVDVGILNLTNYKPPAPDDYYLGQRRMTSELRDLYGKLLDGMQGTRGAIRTGGDAASAALAASPPTQPPLALYSGIVTVKSDGWAEVLFDIPAFAGTVRVMAVAWSKDKVGKASSDVTVRDPVVLTATLPRFLLTGDRGTIRLDLDNVEGPAGDYAIAVQTDGPLQVGQAAQTVKLAGRQRSGVSLPINATAVGIGNVAIKVSGPNGFEMQRTYTLAAKPSTQILTRRTVRPIVNHESISISSDLFADLVPGTGGVQLSVGPSTALDVAALLKALDRYPFGCSEQTTSRALPLLYVNELASESHLSLDAAIDDRIKGAIERLLARQGSNGSFGLWGPGGNDMWLDAYVTDFLTRARERNFAVPDVAFRLALDHLRNHVSQSDPAKNGGSDLAYVYYVLARNGVAPIGDLRYLADTKLDALKTPIGKAQLAAALGMLGDKTRAERVYSAALDDIAPQPKLEFGRTDYGSSLRDASAFVVLAAEGNAPRPAILKAVERIEAARALSAYTSTQENAWMVLAARALARDTAGMALDVSGETRRGPLYRSFRASDLAAGPVRVTNNGDNAVQAVVSVIGAPVTPEPAAEKGFSIERLYYTLDGEPAEIGKVKQNERFAVVLKITEGQPTFGRIIVADYLPAGFEIDNPRLVSSGDTGTLSWIEDAKDPTHSEFRDDRFTAAFDRASGDKAVFTVAYAVRTVSPGKYVLPQVYGEDVYPPARFGRTGVGTVEIEAAK